MYTDAGQPIPFDYGSMDVDYGILRPNGGFLSYGDAFERGLLDETFSDELGRVYASSSDLAAGRPFGDEARLVIPGDRVATDEARGALPPEVPLGDAIANIAAASELVLGIQRSDLTLIGRGLRDRIHQPRRAPLYPRSMEIVAEAERLGAIGATISGAGPSVLVWTFWQSTGKVVDALKQRVGSWAEVRRAPFTPLGADVPEL